MIRGASTSSKIAVGVAALLALGVAGSEFALRSINSGDAAREAARFDEQVAKISVAARDISSRMAANRVELEISSRELAPIEASDPVEADPGNVRLVVTGISWTEERPLAFVNGRVVTAGSKIGDVEILEVLPDRVRVRMPDGEKAALTIRR